MHAKAIGPHRPITSQSLRQSALMAPQRVGPERDFILKSWDAMTKKIRFFLLQNLCMSSVLSTQVEMKRVLSENVAVLDTPKHCFVL